MKKYFVSYSWSDDEASGFGNACIRARKWSDGAAVAEALKNDFPIKKVKNPDSLHVVILFYKRIWGNSK